MKPSLLFIGAVSALSLSIAVPALAAPAAAPNATPQAGQGPGPGRMGPPDGGRMGHRMGRHHMGPGRMGQRMTPEERAKRRAEMFAKMDANKDGRVTEPEFHAFVEARKREREHRAFMRFSGDQASVTLDQLNARALERERAMEQRRERMRENGGRRGPGGPGPGAPPQR